MYESSICFNDSKVTEGTKTVTADVGMHEHANINNATPKKATLLYLEPKIRETRYLFLRIIILTRYAKSFQESRVFF